MRVLVVKSEFQGYKKGDVISDDATMAEIMGGPSQVHVVASDHPVEPTYAPPLDDQE